MSVCRTGIVSGSAPSPRRSGGASLVQTNEGPPDAPNSACKPGQLPQALAGRGVTHPQERPPAEGMGLGADRAEAAEPWNVRARGPRSAPHSLLPLPDSFSHGPGGWKAKVAVSAGSGSSGPLFLVGRGPSSPCVPMWPLRCSPAAWGPSSSPGRQSGWRAQRPQCN